MTRYALDILAIDEAGLDATDRRLLTAMIELYDGGPVGLSTIAMNISEDIETVEDMYEPYLLQQGFIMRTRRGRRVTAKGYEHLGYSPPTQKEED